MFGIALMRKLMKTLDVLGWTEVGNKLDTS